MNIKERLYAYIHEKGLSVLGFERSCGLSNGFVSSVGDQISLRSLELIQAAHPDLSRNWLLTGEGEMLNASEILPSAAAALPSVTLPGEAWAVIRQQAASLEVKDRQLDRCISLLEDSFALLKGAAAPMAAAAAAADGSAG